MIQKLKNQSAKQNLLSSDKLQEGSENQQNLNERNCQGISGISSILSKYDYFLVDVWGVVHDGSELYSGVIETLKLIKDNNKKLCFLSNAPRRASKLVSQFADLGINSGLYDFIITSGEAVFEYLKKNQKLGFKEFGKKYFYIGPKRDFGLLDGLLYEATQDLAESSFILVTGFENDDSKLEENIPYILQARKYNLKMICANPDLKVVRKSGQEVICAGALAKYYQEELDGEVFYFGKPYSRVYELAFNKFAINDKSKVLAIGDAIETDILGAVSLEIDSLFVMGGIYSKHLIQEKNDICDTDFLTTVCNLHQSFPNYTIPNFTS